MYVTDCNNLETYKLVEKLLLILLLLMCEYNLCPWSLPDDLHVVVLLQEQVRERVANMEIWWLLR